MEEWIGQVFLWANIILTGVAATRYEESVKREWWINSEKKEGYDLNTLSKQKLIKGEEWQRHVDDHFEKRNKVIIL